jgi:hypothetical protein
MGSAWVGPQRPPGTPIRSANYAAPDSAIWHRPPSQHWSYLGAPHSGDREGVEMADKKRPFLTAPGNPAKERRQIAPDEKVPLQLNARERELILKHTFADEEVTGRLRIVPRSGESPVYRFTLDDLDELAGSVAAEANHANR